MKRAQHMGNFIQYENGAEHGASSKKNARFMRAGNWGLIAFAAFFCVVMLPSKVQATKFQDPQVQQQSNDSTVSITSHLNIAGDPRIETLLQIHREESARRRGVEGYRLQIYTGSGDDSKQEAYRVKARFLGLYPDVEADVVFNAPEFKVRVGNFRDKSEALRARTRFQGEFFNAFLVEDFISLPDIITEEQATAE